MTNDEPCICGTDFTCMADEHQVCQTAQDCATQLCGACDRLADRFAKEATQ